MKKKLVLPVKIFVFLLLFYVLCVAAAFVFRDDANAYTRVLMHEFHSQENIDLLFCGASHVSHGILPEMADELTGKRTFCAGTPSQKIRGAYALVQEAASLYDLEKVFVELDFAVVEKSSFWENSPSKSDYLVADYIENIPIKISYYLNCSSPKYYLNSFLPIGNGRLLNLNPASVYKTFISKITGAYYRYEFFDPDADYFSKGCLSSHDFIEKGSYSSEVESPIPVQFIHPEYKETVFKIIDFCEKKGIPLAFYINPQSDYYLTEKGNYDEYHQFIKSMLAERGYDFYDFSLCKPEYLSLEDSDFMDDNHLNLNGIPKFTKVISQWINGQIKSEDLFYSSFKEKTDAQPSKIYGVMLTDLNKKAMRVTPVFNHGDLSKITWTFEAEIDGKVTTLAQNTSQNEISYPENTSGNLIITGFYDGIQQTKTSEHYSSL